MQAKEHSSPFREAAVPRAPTGMPYVQVAPGGRYFRTEEGRPFLVVGHNEALPWPRMHHMPATRPYTDSESGPIHLFMDLKRSLQEPFESGYYHNMSWAHLATGGAGGGMPWPFRDPHHLTQEMHEVQRGMSRFMAGIPACGFDWLNFSPRPIDDTMQVVSRTSETGESLPVLPFGCSDGRQALVWLLRDMRVAGAGGRAENVHIDLLLPCMGAASIRWSFGRRMRGTRCGRPV